MTVNAWDTLLSARAIENQCYCIGVNRIGLDGNNLEYPGHSCVYDYSGVQQNFMGTKATTLTTLLNKENLNFFRINFPFHKDADFFKLL